MERQEKVKVGAFVQVWFRLSPVFLLILTSIMKLQEPVTWCMPFCWEITCWFCFGSGASPCYDEIRTRHLPLQEFSSYVFFSMHKECCLNTKATYTILIFSPTAYARPSKLLSALTWIPASRIARLFSQSWFPNINMTTWVLVPHSYRLIPTVSVLCCWKIQYLSAKITLFIFTKYLIQSLINSTKLVLFLLGNQH